MTSDNPTGSIDLIALLARLGYTIEIDAQYQVTIRTDSNDLWFTASGSTVDMALYRAAEQVYNHAAKIVNELAPLCQAIAPSEVTA